MSYHFLALQPASLMGGDAGSKFFYEVTWRVNAGAPRYLEVVVYWPKNRELAGGDWSGAGLNCPGTNNCYSAQYFGYR